MFDNIRVFLKNKSWIEYRDTENYEDYNEELTITNKQNDRNHNRSKTIPEIDEKQATRQYFLLQRT